MGTAPDATVWSAARSGDFILVTQDADFADMASLLGLPPKVIWLRCGNSPTSFVANLLRRHLPAIMDFEADEKAACLERG